MSYSVAVVDDHLLLGQAIGQMVAGFEKFDTLYECANGAQIIDKLKLGKHIPQIILMDINMPIMDGIEATRIISKQWPEIKIMALSVEDDDTTILKMLKAGAHGYLLKDTKKAELESALVKLMELGYYHTTNVAKLLVNSLQQTHILDTLKEREKEFMLHACSELTYKQIADKMCVSPKTVEGYRDSLYEKLAINNRIGLVLFALKNKLISLK